MLIVGVLIEAVLPPIREWNHVLTIGLKQVTFSEWRNEGLVVDLGAASGDVGDDEVREQELARAEGPVVHAQRRDERKHVGGGCLLVGSKKLFYTRFIN